MRHIETQHVSPHSIECPVCGKRFSRRDNMTEHLGRVHSQRLWWKAWVCIGLGVTGRIFVLSLDYGRLALSVDIQWYPEFWCLVFGSGLYFDWEEIIEDRAESRIIIHYHYRSNNRTIDCQLMQLNSAPCVCMHIRAHQYSCLLYTSDAADDMQCVDLGCRRIIKKKKKKNEFFFFKQKTAYFFFSSRRRHTR